MKICSTILRRLIVISAALTIALFASSFIANESKGTGPAALLEIKGPIGPAISDYIHRSLEKAKEMQASMVILRMDTPGGLDTSMREIILDILASEIPIVTYVAPDGARAASAGTYILYASHIAAMAPATNLGAATPILIGGESGPLPLPDGGKPKSKPTKPHPTLSEKAINDAVAYIRSLAQLHGRNADWAEKAVLEAASLSAQEALKENVINLIASNIDELLKKLDGTTVKVMKRSIKLQTKGMIVINLPPDWRTELLSIISNPNVAYILLLIGFYGLVFEFTHPGTIVPGVVGATCLFIALFGLHVLPINYAGLVLIVMGIGFMVTEAFLPAFGAFGIVGVIAFIIGSVMLLDTDIPGYGISWPLIITMAAITGGFLMMVITLAAKARTRPIVSGREGLVGTYGHVLDWSNGEGLVRALGEIWRASAQKSLKPGQRVKVTKIKGLRINVDPVKDKEEE